MSWWSPCPIPGFNGDGKSRLLPIPHPSLKRGHRGLSGLSIAGLQDVDYRSKTFSCSQCGSEAYLAVIEPIKEAGMQDYRLDAIERPERHPVAIDRLTGRGSSAAVDLFGR